MFLHQQLTKQLIGAYYDVYNELGFGYLESVYQRALEIALRDRRIEYVSQASIAVWYRGQQVGRFWADLLVEDVVIVELKACRALDPSHEAQVLNYLCATEIEVGFLLNFGERPAFKRLLFTNDRKNGHR